MAKFATVFTSSELLKNAIGSALSIQILDVIHQFIKDIYLFHKSIIYSYFSYSFGFSDSATCQEDRILSFFKHTSGFVLRIEENCHMQTYSQLFHLFRLNRRYNLSHRWIIRTFHYDLLLFRVIHLFIVSPVSAVCYCCRSHTASSYRKGHCSWHSSRLSSRRPPAWFRRWCLPD